MTKKDIELPPLPVGTTSPIIHGAYYCATDMQDYARDAIQADRQQRGEPVAWRWQWKDLPDSGWQLSSVGGWRETDAIRAEPLYLAPIAQLPAEVPFCEECGDGIMAHDPGICGTCYDTKYMTQQHTEPAKDDSDALTVAYMSGFYDGKKAAPKFGEEE